VNAKGIGNSERVPMDGIEMGFKTVSEDGHADYEIWTCDKCGYSIILAGTGGDVAECPQCIENEYAGEVAHGTEEEMPIEPSESVFLEVQNEQNSRS